MEDRSALSGRQSRQGHSGPRWQLAIDGGDGVAVGIVPGMSHLGVQACHGVRGECVLTFLSYIVPVGGFYAGPVSQVALPEPMTADDAEGI